MARKINHVLIVGGGTAGWLTAARLAKKFKSESNGLMTITLIESSNIPTVGVGEGTWPTIRDTLKKLDIDETDFINECDATFKQGARFVSWRNSPSEEPGNYYHHLFTSLYDPWDFNLAPYWSKNLSSEKTYAEAVSMQGDVCELGLAPKTIATPQYEGLQGYAYHLDAGKFAEMLKRKAINDLNVSHIVDDVEKVNVNESDWIDSIITKTGLKIEADLFIDCSGFGSKLLGEALGIPFVSVSDVLFSNRAVALQVPYENVEHPIACETISTAQPEGWIWDIGLQSRRGIGFVYSDEYLKPEDAEQRLREYAGQDTSNIKAKHLSFDVGYREKFWHNNCLAVGLSAAFVEPLEASAIFLIEAAVNMLCEKFPQREQDMDFIAQQFNQSFGFRWDKTVEFIKMHYVLSQRTDGEFWINNKQPETIPESLKMKLQHWEANPLSRYDFDNAFEPFVLDSYQYVLYGMGFKTQVSDHYGSRDDERKAQQMFAKVETLREAVKGRLPSHRELLNKLKEYKFPRI
ncbi:tryptophan 7-halogenase [Pseudoalteromonas luteoviolacea]|uniref:tryptophan halogenase family protein n=1 Tax=Pseudoalteromonas luteoviolacea TaxID=43657 RepID=UPI001F28F7AC|nr:tryptophan halogenase family protein [Pseudoalteromonas luteoviolacea]MCF6442615.1 tryptophan 7-halogenase [Pseudoalteromonas luteoviolacea]